MVTFAVASLLRATIGLRVDRETVNNGIDETEHAESGYEFMPIGGGGSRATEGSFTEGSFTRRRPDLAADGPEVAVEPAVAPDQGKAER